MNRIVGIVLVRNEERFIDQVVRNIAGFCDEILLVDHESRDSTVPILKRLTAEFPHSRLHEIKHPTESHELLQGFVNTPTWIFGVDGDELYEPARLAEFRVELASGKFDASWMILGNVLHCDELDATKGTGKGYLSPPSRSMTKFYNFHAITSWGGYAPERLHGGEVFFKPGFDETQRANVHEELDWEQSYFRCLHLCFLNRSSVDANQTGGRPNIVETHGSSYWQEWLRWTRRLLRVGKTSEWKQERYRRGERISAEVAGFFESDGRIR